MQDMRFSCKVETEFIELSRLMTSPDCFESNTPYHSLAQDRYLPTFSPIEFIITLPTHVHLK